MLAAHDLGVDLSGHRSMPLTRELAAKADCIVAMTQGHLLSIAYYYPDAGERSILLRADGADVADPIGCEMEVYRSCAAEIGEHLRPLISNWIRN
jgi:protein-tyrosine-phosphatase